MRSCAYGRPIVGEYVTLTRPREGPGRADPRRRVFMLTTLNPYIKHLVDAFGPRRTFWGTDLTRMPCTYRECVSLFTKELPWLTGETLNG